MQSHSLPRFGLLVPFFSFCSSMHAREARSHGTSGENGTRHPLQRAEQRGFAEPPLLAFSSQIRDLLQRCLGTGRSAFSFLQDSPAVVAAACSVGCGD